MGDAGGNVGRDALIRRFSDGGPQVEVLRPLRHAGAAVDVIDDHRVDPGLGEAAHQVLVKGVHPAWIGDDDHAGATRRRRSGRVRPETIAVGGGQHQVGVIG